MTKRLCVYLGALVSGALLTAAAAAQTQTAPAGTASQLQGRVISAGNGHFVIQTSDNRQLTVYTNPQTRYLNNNQAANFSDLRAGSNVNFGYTLTDGRYYAGTVNLLPPGGPAPAQGAVPAPAPAQPAPAVVPPAAPPGPASVLQGEVVRVIGNNQVVVRTADGKEIILYTGPQTTYLYNDQPAVFTDLQPGMAVNANYTVQNGRHLAGRILGRRR